MSIVLLVSGGLDSTLMASLALEVGAGLFPLFINYGQRAKQQEYEACCRSMARIGVPAPSVANLEGFGTLIRSGLTDPGLDVCEDAFTPGRNMLFLLVGGAYAYKVGADAVSIGLLNEETSLFPDQTVSFVRKAEELLSLALGEHFQVLTPLMDFGKCDVVELARQKGIEGTYSCHVGGIHPCGKCISCREFQFEEK